MDYAVSGKSKAPAFNVWRGTVAGASAPSRRGFAGGAIFSGIGLGIAASGTIVLGRVNELLVHQPAAQKAAWSKATTSFAVLQAVAAYGLSFLFSASGGNYLMLFVIGAASLALALAVDLFAAPRSK